MIIANGMIIRPALLSLLCAIVLLSGFSAPAQQPVNGAAKTATTNEIVVQEVDADGLTDILRRKRSGPLLVNFWATWCDPCREEFPDLVKIDSDYRAKGLEVITVSLDDFEDIKTGVPQFIREMKATMPAYLLNVSDPEPAIKSVDPEWRGALPATFLYDSKGAIAFKYFGRFKPQELRAAIEKLVGSKQ
jgi:thiol-disulfide isomerase/thioredoxin